MRRSILILLATAASASAQNARELARRDSIAFRDSVIAMESRFLAQWDTAWKFSERDRHGFSAYGDAVVDDGSRHANYHCHPDARGVRMPLSQGRLIQSNHSWFSVCPSFELGEVRTVVEEKWDIDASLMRPRRPAIRALRDSLIARLDSAVRRYPADEFFVGQRVRFLVDQWSFDSALVAVRNCGAPKWWCGMLAGYVHAARNEMARADSAFDAGIAAMPEKVRCEWTDYRLVIDRDWRDKYEGTSCAKRIALNERMWWLSDPLFIEPGNERRTEQHVRLMQVELRSALPRDERFDWRDKAGGDARVAMLKRYGWPSYAFWGGPFQDRVHSGYLQANKSGPNEPYTTYEYFGSRVHVIPRWSAIEDPFRAEPGDWTLTKPAAQDSALPRVNMAPALYTTRGVAPPKQGGFWWPVEHFQPRKPLVQLPNGQQALLRRYNGAVLAVATHLTAERVDRRDGDEISDIKLVASENAQSIHEIATGFGVTGQSFSLSGLIGTAPIVAGLEFLGSDARATAGRIRFGVVPPPPLSSLAPAEIGISDPVILEAPLDDSALPNETAAALRRMSSSVFFAKRKFGIYWETYGLRPTDSVEVAVWIERAGSVNIVRRFGIALGVATDLNTPMSVSWKEPDPSHRTHIVPDGPVPIIARSVIIDASNVPPGEYRIEVAIRKLGTPEPIRGRTTIVIR